MRLSRTRLLISLAALAYAPLLPCAPAQSAPPKLTAQTVVGAWDLYNPEERADATAHRQVTFTRTAGKLAGKYRRSSGESLNLENVRVDEKANQLQFAFSVGGQKYAFRMKYVAEGSFDGSMKGPVAGGPVGDVRMKMVRKK